MAQLYHSLGYEPSSAAQRENNLINSPRLGFAGKRVAIGPSRRVPGSRESRLRGFQPAISAQQQHKRIFFTPSAGRR